MNMRPMEVHTMESVTWLRPVVALFVLATAAGCGSTPEAGDADAGSDVDAPDVDVDTCTPERMCHADFPCWDRSFCRDQRTVVQCEPVGCWSPRVCGTSCCEGGSCLESLEAPTVCSEGLFCFEDPNGYPEGFRGPGRVARCLPDPDADAGESSDADYDAYSRHEVFEPYCR